MKHLLLFAFAVIVSLCCAQTAPVIESAKIIGRGFDMVKGTQNRTGNPGPTLNVFEWDFSQGKTYTDPFNPSSTYAIPDQVELTPIDASQTNINEALVQSFDMWITQKRSAFNVGIGITIGNGTQAFSMNAKYSRETYQYDMNMKAKLAASGFSNHWWNLYKLEGLPPFMMKLDPSFKAAIQYLPKTISNQQDQDKYNQFVEYFGTHYVIAASFGGEVDVSTFVDKSIFAHHSQSWVEQQFALEFHYYLFNISTGGFSNRSKIHINEQFKQAAKTFIFFKGGNPGLQSNTTVGQWIPTIAQEPSWLNVTIADLSVLLEDTYPNRAKVLHKVIAAYIDTGKLPGQNAPVRDFDEFYKPYHPDNPSKAYLFQKTPSALLDYKYAKSLFTSKQSSRSA